VASSLDGFIAGPDDGLDWLTKYEPAARFDGEPMTGSYDRFMEGVGALAMGSATYEWLLAEIDEWPYRGTPAWVLTSREPPRREGEDVDVRFAEAKVADVYDEMIAAADGRNLWVVGGGNVASQFADAGLLDELIVTVVPVVLGEGKPLFDRAVPGGPMKLTSTRAFDTGMVELRYELGR
jgi:dihydrofolate reductase